MSKLDKIIVGIRDSKLSRAQTDILLNQLITVADNINTETFEIKTIKTKGTFIMFNDLIKLVVKAYL